VLFPHISLRENIAFSLRLRHRPAGEVADRVQELAELLRIAHLLDRRPGTLSGGEQQRGALARALAPRPTVLLLDEPLSALDEGTRAELAPELASLSRDLGTTVIHVCHNFDEALQLADRIAIIRAGQVIQVGNPANVFRQPDSAFVAKFVGAENLFPVTASSPVAGTITVGQGVELQVSHLPQGDSLLAMIRPEEVTVRHGQQAVPAVNGFGATVREVEDRGRLVRLHLEGPLPLLVALTPQAFRDVGIVAGESVQVHCPPDTVHVIVRDEA
jgi:ABC-type Fe3+/spermidine/putrescine transport system ATPase subunit